MYKEKDENAYTKKIFIFGFTTIYFLSKRSKMSGSASVADYVEYLKTALPSLTRRKFIAIPIITKSPLGMLVPIWGET